MALGGGVYRKKKKMMSVGESSALADEAGLPASGGGVRCACGRASIVRSMPKLVERPAKALLPQIGVNHGENGPSPMIWPATTNGPLHVITTKKQTTIAQSIKQQKHQ